MFADRRVPIFNNYTAATFTNEINTQVSSKLIENIGSKLKAVAEKDGLIDRSVDIHDEF